MDEKTEAALIRAGHQIQSLQDRVTELEQQLADASRLVGYWKGLHDLELSIRSEAEAKLTGRDKLLDKCEEYIKKHCYVRSNDGTDGVALLTKLQEKRK